MRPPACARAARMRPTTTSCLRRPRFPSQPVFPFFMNQPRNTRHFASLCAGPSYIQEHRLLACVREMAALTQPASIYWCDSSTESTTASAASWSDRHLQRAEQKRSARILTSPAATVRRRPRGSRALCCEKKTPAPPTTGWRPTRPTSRAAPSTPAVQRAKGGANMCG